MVNQLIVVMFKIFVKWLFESEEYVKEMSSEILPMNFTERTQSEGSIHICRLMFLQVLLF